MNHPVLSDVFLTFSIFFGFCAIVVLIEKSLINSYDYKIGSESFLSRWGTQIIFVSLSFILAILAAVF